MYECVCICIYLCVLNVPLNIKGFCILLKMLFQVLTFGQAYQISLQLEMPDSPANREQGMFMIRAACFSRDGGQVASSSRHVSSLSVVQLVCTYNQIMLLVCTNSTDSLHCCVFRRQVNSCLPPALAL